MKEIDAIITSYKDLKYRLKNLNYDVYSDRNYEVDRNRYIFDIVVKKGEIELALFEFKAIIGNDLAPNIKKELQDLCNRYMSLFPKAKPLIFVSNGEVYYEYTSDIQFESPIKIDNVCDKIRSRGKEGKRYDPNYSFFVNLLKKSNIPSVVSFAKRINDSNYTEYFEEKEKYFYFKYEYEKEFFMKLLDKKPHNKLFRYTTLDNLYKSLKDKKQSMVSLLAMEDVSESYYADKYVNKNMSRDMEAEDYTEHYEKSCRCFIMSCVEDCNEDLQMWDKYGDAAKGVRIEFDVNCQDSIPFCVAPVSYEEEEHNNSKLALIAEMRKMDWHMKRWDVWQHFFKPYEYRNEKEIRILYFVDEKEFPSENILWINKENLLFPIISFSNSFDDALRFPFRINNIVLGPIAKNQDINRVVIGKMIQCNNIYANSHVTVSAIRNEHTI